MGGYVVTPNPSVTEAIVIAFLAGSLITRVNGTVISSRDFEITIPYISPVVVEPPVAECVATTNAPVYCSHRFTDTDGNTITTHDGTAFNMLVTYSEEVTSGSIIYLSNRIFAESTPSGDIQRYAINPAGSTLPIVITHAGDDVRSAVGSRAVANEDNMDITILYIPPVAEPNMVNRVTPAPREGDFPDAVSYVLTDTSNVEIQGHNGDGSGIRIFVTYNFANMITAHSLVAPTSDEAIITTGVSANTLDSSRSTAIIGYAVTPNPNLTEAITVKFPAVSVVAFINGQFGKNSQAFEITIPYTP